jgi:hypothetical protein
MSAHVRVCEPCSRIYEVTRNPLTVASGPCALCSQPANGCTPDVQRVGFLLANPDQAREEGRANLIARQRKLVREIRALPVEEKLRVAADFAEHGNFRQALSVATLAVEQLKVSGA